MARFEIQRLPGAPVERGTFKDGVRLIDWLNSADVHASCVVKINGKELDDDFDLNHTPSVFDVVQVFDQPRGGVGKVFQTVMKPVAKILTTVMSLLGMGSKSANLSVSTGESSNNDLTQQTNRARLYKMRPNIYGQVRSYPDLIQESLFEYINNKKYVTEFMEIGYGHYDISSVRYSESSLLALDGASYDIYNPGDTIGQIIEGYSFDDVDGQELYGPNSATGDVQETGTSTDIVEATFSGGQFYLRINKATDFDYFNDQAKPIPVSVTLNVTYSTASGSVTKDVTIAGNIFKSEIVADETSGSDLQYYDFYFEDLSGTDYNSLPSDTTVNKTSITITQYEGVKEGPFFGAVTSTQLWVHLYGTLDGGSSANATIEYWQVDDDNNRIEGTDGSVLATLTNSGSDSDYIYLTTKITPSAGTGRYAFTVVRNDNDSSSSEIYISAAHAINIRENVVYPDDTLVKVVVRQTETQTSSTERKYNCLAERKVIGYNRTTGEIDYTLTASRNFADAVLHEWVIIAQQPVSRLDVAGLYAIADSLSDEQLGYFDYTFSDATQSLGDRLQIICNVANVSLNWIGGVLTFWINAAVDYPDAVFGRSRMFADSYKLAYSMSLQGGYDGVALTYTDPDTNKSAYIYLSVSEDGIAESTDSTLNPSSITLSGCRNVTQATQRAYLEARKMIYSRLTMTVMVLESTQVVRGAVVQCPDLYDTTQQTGYLTGRDGNTFYTSETIDFSSGTLYVVMTDSDGNYRGRWQVAAVAGNRNAFSADADQFSFNVYDGKDVQSPSRYYIASDDDLNATLWRVDSSKPNGDETQTLTLVEYSPSIYS
ncbi:MAG: hypothetical protein [Bacteriophage sp.]|nr:MAG: hypothetical protein [Bacteriophage sp.]